MWGLIGAVFSWIVGLFTKSTRDDEVALGRAQQQVSDSKADLTVIQKANKAAQSPAEIKEAQREADLDRGL